MREGNEKEVEIVGACLHLCLPVRDSMCVSVCNLKLPRSPGALSGPLTTWLTRTGLEQLVCCTTGSANN